MESPLVAPIATTKNLTELIQMWVENSVDAQVWDAHAGLNGGCECESAVRARFEALQDLFFRAKTGLSALLF